MDCFMLCLTLCIYLMPVKPKLGCAASWSSPCQSQSPKICFAIFSMFNLLWSSLLLIMYVRCQWHPAYHHTLVSVLSQLMLFCTQHVLILILHNNQLFLFDYVSTLCLQRRPLLALNEQLRFSANHNWTFFSMLLWTFCIYLILVKPSIGCAASWLSSCQRESLSNLVYRSLKFNVMWSLFWLIDQLRNHCRWRPA